MVELRATQIVSGALPFSAVVGQEQFKDALLAVAANDALDGLLVRGEKGTAKSTTVRALADLLPTQRAVADCPYGCPPGDTGRQCADCRERIDPPVEERPVPLVTLPLGATRERVVGSLSVADALDGDYEFEPGLLARANRGILYVDEVNLLDDHLVDVLLDAAASGVNRVERDSVSVTHPAEFTLVGTMNPEEGDLRPQLRDRFALQATVTGCEAIEDRVAIVDRALGREQTDASDDEVRERLHIAQEILGDVALPGELLEDVAELCLEAGVEGHRGDIATARAARTFAALDGRTTVTEGDVRTAAELALPHRLQSRPFEDVPAPDEVVDEHFDDETTPEETDGEGDGESANGDSDEAERGGEESDEPDADSGEEHADGDATKSDPERRDRVDGGDDAGGPQPSPGRSDDGGADRTESGADDEGGEERTTQDGTGHGRRDHDGDGGEQSEHDDDGDGGDQDEATPVVPGQSRSAVAEVGDSANPTTPTPDADGGTDARPGSRARTDPSTDASGPRVRTERAEDARSVDAAASVRAAAARGETSVESRDLRQSVRASEASALVVFAVDASASMRPAMRAAKGTVLELLKDAYQQRDEVAFVAFAGDDADVLLPPTDSITLAARHLKDLPTGDRTPLPAGLDTAGDVLDKADPAASIVVVVTDGRANAAENPVADTRAAARRLADRDAHVLVVDAGDGGRATLTDLLVEETDGRRVSLDALSADRVDASVGAARETQL